MSSLNAEAFKNMMVELRKLSGDDTLVCIRIMEGSIKLILDGGSEALRVLEALFDEGKLAEICGLRILAIQPLPQDLPESLPPPHAQPAAPSTVQYLSATARRQRRLESLFHAAVELPTHLRVAFLEEACGNDREMRRRLEELLAADQQVVERQRGDQPDTGTRPPGSDHVHEIRPGIRIDRYTLIRELGKGGMGIVYLARDTVLMRPVAMKFVHVGSPDQAKRFIQEARLTARCEHENIVAIHDIGEHQGRPYMVLEYLEGASLRARMKGPLASSERSAGLDWQVQQALDAVIPVVQALVYAHAQSIVHRDLKPENIFMTRTGAVKVLDFGIAKVISDIRGALPMVTCDPTQDVDLLAWSTQPGKIIGTPAYMAPEQWNQDGIDPQTDLWAVGIILHELVTGKHPLDPLSHARLLSIGDLSSRMPMLRAEMPELGQMASIIDGCLQKRKTERINSALELLDALHSLPARAGMTM